MLSPEKSLIHKKIQLRYFDEYIASLKHFKQKAIFCNQHNLYFQQYIYPIGYNDSKIFIADLEPGKMIEITIIESDLTKVLKLKDGIIQPFTLTAIVIEASYKPNKLGISQFFKMKLIDL